MPTPKKEKKKNITTILMYNKIICCVQIHK